jgi:hypothetical protein
MSRSNSKLKFLPAPITGWVCLGLLIALMICLVLIIGTMVYNLTQIK